jgi:hypothetical protein
LGDVLSTFVSIAKWLRRELLAIWPVFLFFLFGFLMLLLLIKLALAKFSVEIAAFPKAIVGALFAAKAVLVLDDTSLARHLEHRRRIVAVAVKTLLYGAITVLIGYLERIIEALRHSHRFDGVVRYVFDQEGVYKLLAWALGISLMFAIYFSIFEISQRFGKKELFKLFFESPKAADERVSTRAVP